MDGHYYALIIGVVFFWAFYRIVVPKKEKYASSDFIRTETIEEKERKIITKSALNQTFYPLYLLVNKYNPMSQQSYDTLQELIEKSGEYKTTPEDIQMAQLSNAVTYPIFLGIIAFLFGGEYKTYIFGFGLFMGFYMYGGAVRTLKGKQKEHNERLLSEFTRFVTVYLMLVSGNKIAYDALVETVDRVKVKTGALGFYLNKLEKDLSTRTPESALRRFSETLNKPYVDRFVNNVLLSMQQADHKNSEINLRLRETLIELQNDMVNQKISRMKMQARIPVYSGVGLIAIYMIVILGVSLFLLF